MKNKNIITISTLSLFSLTTLSALAMSMPNSFADTSATTTTSITVSSACSISADNTSPHTATVFPGHEEIGIGNTTMTVQCNDASGSAIYAIGFSNDTLGNTNMIDTSTSASFPTGTGTSSSNWSMKLSIPIGNTAPTIRSDATYDFTDYEVVPDDYALVATFPSSANGTSNSSFSATYRAYVGGSQAPGTYTGKVKYTLVHPSNATAPSIYTISYVDASGEATGLPASQTGEVTSTANVTLSSTEPTRTDYTFNGWCSVNNSADTSACSGTTYDLGDTYTITSSVGDINVTLYAVWESTCVVNTPYMQDWNGASSLAEEETIYLRDKRDEQCYSVAKLKDGKVWMTTNLNIAGGTTLSSETTDFDSSYTIPSTEGWGANGTLPASSMVLAGYTSGSTTAVLYNSGNKTNCGAGQYTNTPCYSYYSWDVTTLGSVRESSTPVDAPYSVCPKGWRLPLTRTSDMSNWETISDLYQLATAYGMTNRIEYEGSSAVLVDFAGSSFYDNAGPGTVANFLFSGRVGNEALVSVGLGYYWTASSLWGNTGNGTYGGAQLNTSRTYFGTTNHSMASLQSVRCIKR